jgi:hypothetical protein
MLPSPSCDIPYPVANKDAVVPHHARYSTILSECVAWGWAVHEVPVSDSRYIEAKKYYNTKKIGHPLYEAWKKEKQRRGEELPKGTWGQLKDKVKTAYT